MVLAECAEVADYIVDNQVGDILGKFGEANLVNIHISD